MIVTLTPNPAIDWTIHSSTFERGQLHRADGVKSEASGKGVNVSRALTTNRVPSTAVVPVGGLYGPIFTVLLEEESVDFLPVPVHGSVRINVSIVEGDGVATKFNAPGPVLAPEDGEALIAATLAAAEDGSWVVASGSLPPGLPADFYAVVGAHLRAGGRRLALDTSGAALAAGLTAAPEVVKPNTHELTEVSGRPLTTVGDVLEAARHLLTLGVGRVLASMGADGALLVGPDGELHGEAEVPMPTSTVGVGDALLAGYLSAGDAAPEQALSEALAWASAALRLPGSQVPQITDEHRKLVTVGRPALDRRLGQSISTSGRAL